MDEIITKKCAKCGLEKPLSEYGKEKRTKIGTKSQCNKCASEKSNEWNRRNKEKTLLSYKKWCSTKSMEFLRERQRKYRKPVPYNKESYEKYKDKHKDANKRWKKNHPEKIAQYNSNRRAMSKGLSGKIFAEDWKKICDKYGNRCLCCGKDEVTIDHVLPLSKGGKHELSNLQPLCLSCNCKKKDKHIDYRS